MTQRFAMMAWDLGNVLSLVDEKPATELLAGICGRSPGEVFEVVFSPARKALFESGRITWTEQYEFARAKLGLTMTLSEYSDLFSSVLTPNEAVFPLVGEMLAQVRCAVASNTSEPHWELERSRLPFGRRLQPEVVSYRVGAMKPDAEFFRALCDLGGVDPSEVVFTDDREDNVQGASKFGITALLYRDHEGLRNDLRSLGFKV